MASTVQVVLTNRFAELLPPYPDAIREYFRYHPPNYFFMPSFRRGGWDGYINLLRRNRVGAGLFLAYFEKIEKDLELSFEIDDIRKGPLRQNSKVLGRPYQVDAVAKMLANSHTGGLILNATGSGKTRISAMYFSRIQGPCCFIVDELTLLDQNRAELEEAMGEPVGNIGNGIWRPRRITVATVQTLHLHRHDPRFREWAKQLEVVIVDELHVALNKRNFETVKDIYPKAVFGLTATLGLKQRPVRLRAYDLAGPVIYEYPLARGVKEGYLSPGLCVSVETVTAVPSGDYQHQYQTAIVEDEDRNDLITGLARAAHAMGKYTLILVERVAHLKRLSNELRDIPHDRFFGEKKSSERTQSKAEFEKGFIKLLIANKVAKKGLNIKRLDVVIDGAALRSKNDAAQKYGRGTRMCDGKKGFLYFDITDLKPSSGRDRFAVSARSRLSALKAIKVPRVRVSAAKLSPEEIMRRADAYLRQHILKEEPK